MPLTPEQFDQIALKVDLDRVEKKIDGLAGNVSQLLTALYRIVKKVEKHLEFEPIKSF